MNYIYDIVLNFQNIYYDFYEWRKEDKIKNYSKLPLYKISDKDLLNLKYNKIIIDTDFMNKLKEDNKKNKTRICIVSNGINSIGLMFNEEGVLLKRSSLIFEEEDEANDYAKHQEIIKIHYKKNIKQIKPNKLRLELEKKDALINYLNKTEDIITLRYLYFEYFEKEEENIDKIKDKLLKEINKEWTNKQHNLYNTINMISKNTPTF